MGYHSVPRGNRREVRNAAGGHSSLFSEVKRERAESVTDHEKMGCQATLWKKSPAQREFLSRVESRSTRLHGKDHDVLRVKPVYPRTHSVKGKRIKDYSKMVRPQFLMEDRRPAWLYAPSTGCYRGRRYSDNLVFEILTDEER